MLNASVDIAEIIVPEDQTDGLAKKIPLHQKYEPSYNSRYLVFNQNQLLWINIVPKLPIIIKWFHLQDNTSK